MSAKNYVISHQYESYIRLARLCGRDDFGAHNSYMNNLMDKEVDAGHVRHLKHSRLLSDVKKYMISATKFAIKRKMMKDDKEQAKLFLNRIEEATTSDELLNVCKEGIEVFVRYKPALEA